jgi:ABC-2 type transport system permease protein
VTAVSHAASPRTDALVGTGALTKLWLRRDRIMLPIWIYGLTAVVASSAAGYKGLYTTPASRQSFAKGITDNPSMLALYGRIYDPSSVGGLTAWRMGATGTAMVAVMSVLIVVRHTRAEEETGRLELLGATVVGRHAPLTAGLVVAFVANLVLAVLVAVSLIFLGLPAAGSIAYGLAWAAAGCVFAAVAAVAAQLTESARAANGIALAALGIAFLLRAAGDSGSSWLAWLSPIGWAQQVRPYAGERWWVLGLAVLFTAAVAGAAYTLTGRRDLGAGILPARLGPAQAAASLRSPLALAWRLQRGTLLAWAAWFAVYGAAIGGVADGINDLVKGSSGTRDVLIKMGGQQSIVDAFLATTMGIMGLLASVYAVQAALRLRAEETAQRLEPLLATPVGRLRWVVSHLVIAALGTAVLLAVAGLATGLTHGLRAHDLSGQLPRLLGAALVQLPAAWVLAAIVVVLFGFAPRLAMAGWGTLAACLLLGQLGPVLKLSQWAMDVSPFTHVPKLPGGDPTATPLISLTLLAALLTVAGLAGFRRRDIG